MKQLGLYGPQIPIKYDGPGLINMEYARIAEELATHSSTPLALSLYHTIAIPVWFVQDYKKWNYCTYLQKYF